MGRQYFFCAGRSNNRTGNIIFAGCMETDLPLSGVQWGGLFLGKEFMVTACLQLLYPQTIEPFKKKKSFHLLLSDFSSSDFASKGVIPEMLGMAA